ncbi:MAG: ribosome maturation factor RimM [Burkholderia sp.]|nr:ribosome maturation factor RimM [Burkholderia sp.]
MYSLDSQVDIEIENDIKSIKELPNDAVEIGIIVGAYGLSGWIKVVAYSNSNIRLKDNTIFNTRSWLLKKGMDCRIATVLNTKIHRTIVVANISGLNNREDAISMRGFSIFSRRSDFPILTEGEFYYVDLIGLSVVNKQFLSLGVVTDIIDNGVHSILQVEYLSIGKTREQTSKKFLIPFVCLYVKTVDLSIRRIIVDWKTDY